MRKFGLSPIYQTPKASAPHPQHRICPCLLRYLEFERPNQICGADLTCIPMRRGFPCLVAIMDWLSRKVLAWRLSKTMAAGFCAAALEEAIARHGRPDIFNTDQGAQFTRFAFTTTQNDAAIRLSMDGRGSPDRQRLHRAAVAQPQIRVRVPQRLPDRQRPHPAFGGSTSDEVHAMAEMSEQSAASKQHRSTLARPPNGLVRRDNLKRDKATPCAIRAKHGVNATLCAILHRL